MCVWGGGGSVERARCVFSAHIFSSELDIVYGEGNIGHHDSSVVYCRYVIRTLCLQ